MGANIFLKMTNNPFVFKKDGKHGHQAMIEQSIMENMVVIS